MPSADVVVVGSGLAGLTCAVQLAERGARVVVVAAGHATLTWAAGPLDVAAPPEALTSRDGIEHLARLAGHPYAVVAEDAAPAVGWFSALANRGGLPYHGDLDRPFRPLPTALGALRRVGLVPGGMAAALPPWGRDERLVVVGLAGFKDLWPAAAAAGLRLAYASADGPGPARISGLNVALPNLAGRRNLSALDLARAFDRPAERRAMLRRVAAALEAHAAGPRRVALPAVLGLEDHAAALAETADALGGPVFEVPLVPPSIPGLRLHALLRRAFLRLGGRVLMGEAVARVELTAGGVARVVVPAAARETAIAVTRLVLATGGLAGGGLVAEPDGRIRESVLGLPVVAPPVDDWLAADAFAPGGHPIAAAGLATDGRLRPLGGPHGAAADAPLLAGVWAIGGLLAGQRVVRERCGDGVALASAWRVAGQAAEAAA
ncbi:MAG: anaerobic glycerol-3-phosphate dehydrogenase subunit GlpB [Candidatus Limnocylindrales bacterium]